MDAPDQINQKSFTEGSVQGSSSRFPDPPDHCKRYTDENIMGATPENIIVATQPPQPPPEPIFGTYTIFGESHDTTEPVMRTLESQGITRLYALDCDSKAELKKLNHSILANFLDLLEVLIRCPTREETEPKLKDIELLFINMHHLINEYRPHQARETLRLMMEVQLQERRETTERFQKFYDVVANQLRNCLADIPAPPVKLVSTDMESKIVKILNGEWLTGPPSDTELLSCGAQVVEAEKAGNVDASQNSSSMVIDPVDRLMCEDADKIMQEYLTQSHGGLSNQDSFDFLPDVLTSSSNATGCDLSRNLYVVHSQFLRLQSKDQWDRWHELSETAKADFCAQVCSFIRSLQRICRMTGIRLAVLQRGNWSQINLASQLSTSVSSLAKVCYETCGLIKRTKDYRLVLVQDALLDVLQRFESEVVLLLNEQAELTKWMVKSRTRDAVAAKEKNEQKRSVQSRRGFVYLKPPMAPKGYILPALLRAKRQKALSVPNSRSRRGITAVSPPRVRHRAVATKDERDGVWMPQNELNSALSRELVEEVASDVFAQLCRVCDEIIDKLWEEEMALRS